MYGTKKFNALIHLGWQNFVPTENPNLSDLQRSGTVTNLSQNFKYGHDIFTFLSSELDVDPNLTSFETVRPNKSWVSIINVVSKFYIVRFVRSKFDMSLNFCQR